MKKIYQSKPLSYRQWGQIRKEMYRLVFCIAAIVFVGFALNVAAEALVQLIHTYGLH